MALTLEAVRNGANRVAGFSTSVDVREGQMVVVGKTSFEAGQGALIAVLSTRVLD